MVLSAAPTQAGDVSDLFGDYFVDTNAVSIPKNLFPTNYLEGHDTTLTPYATTSGVSGGHPAHVTFDFGSNLQEVSGFYIDSFNSVSINGADAALAVIGQYEVQVAVSGTGFDDADYQTVASGVNNLTAPIWVDVDPVVARYVRLIYKNRGLSWRTQLVKFWAFSKETIDKGFSLILTRVREHDSVGFYGRTININQDVDLSGIDYIYVRDLKVYAYSGGTEDLGVISVTGADQWDFIRQARLGDVSKEFITIHGLSLNVSSVSNATFTLSHQFRNTSSQDWQLVSFGGVTTVPGWFSEQFSSFRGSSAQFPNEVLFVVDKRGMSIIDVSNVSEESEVKPFLWMRFDLGERKMLRLRPRDVFMLDGRVFMATSHGLYVFDFPANKAVCFDELGPRIRFGIDLRNVDDFDFSGATGIPKRSNYTYARFFDSPVIPELDLYAISGGKGSSDFIVIGSASGLIIFNNKLDDTAVFYQSLDRRPVHSVTVLGRSVWYLQGVGSATTASYIEDVESVTSDGFIPDRRYYSGLSFDEALNSGKDPVVWDVLNYDSGMQVDFNGGFLTISGSHLQGGPTGLISKEYSASRSFSATVKVRIRDFPLDARGGVRFGFVHDYLDGGIRSLYSSGGFSSRKGFFFSALNIDPVGGRLAEDSLLLSDGRIVDRSWHYAAAQRPSSSQEARFVTPTVSGIKATVYGFNSFSGDQLLVRVVSSRPLNRRKFTARLDVQLASGMDPYSNLSLVDNASAWFGIGNKATFYPGTTGTGDYINGAMVVLAEPTFSGIAVYSVGRYDSTATPSDFVRDHALVSPVLSSEVQGESSPFREWRIDFDPFNGVLDSFIDNTYINSIQLDETTHPPVHGITFGVYGRSSSSPPERRVYFKNIRFTYPSLNPSSRYKYGLEIVGSDGGVYNNLSPYTSVSGIYASFENTPASGTLSSSVSLTDGNLHIGGTTATQGASFGVCLSGTLPVEALYLYDVHPETSGWADAAGKGIEVWKSSDNLIWQRVTTADLNFIGRVSGVTKLFMEPAVSTKYLKVFCTSSTNNYTVGGGYSWDVSEIQAVTLSGVDFFPGDATEGASFHEWRLDYNANSREIKGYIDGVLVSTGQLPYDMDEGRFVLVHDLVPVNSGTSTSFCGDFKDIVISFSTPSVLPSGSITSFYAARNVTSSGVDNNSYVLLAASDTEALVSKVVMGADELADVIEKTSFSGSVFLGGDSPVRASFIDSQGSYDSGLSFFGTGSVSKTPYYLSRYKKPFWIEGESDPNGGSEIAYGGRFSIGYHPGRDVLFEFIGTHASYAVTLDFNSGLWDQITQEHNWRAMGKGVSLVAHVIFDDIPKVLYAPYIDQMVYLAASKLGVFFIPDGQAVHYAIPDTTFFAGSGHYYITYLLHDHSILYGQDYLERWDVVNGVSLTSPRTWGSNSHRWNRFRTQVPFNSGGGFVGGSVQAVYCDYDKAVYFIGKVNSNTTGGQLFYRYDTEKDWLDAINTVGVESVVWPGSSDSLLPLSMKRSYSVWPVYDPVQKRIYFFGARATHPQMYYYDVVSQRWGVTGEQPPYVAIRNWPGTAGDGSVSRAVYRSSNDSFIVYGPSDRDEIYEYFPERDSLATVFDYSPRLDGLPTSSGTSKHFTVNKSTLLSVYQSTQDFDRDFYRVPTDNNTGVAVTLDSEKVTVSGLDLSVGNSVVRTRDFYVS